jgi:hypothetical protein
VRVYVSTTTFLEQHGPIVVVLGERTLILRCAPSFFVLWVAVAEVACAHQMAFVVHLHNIPRVDAAVAVVAEKDESVNDRFYSIIRRKMVGLPLFFLSLRDQQDPIRDCPRVLLVCGIGP